MPHDLRCITIQRCYDVITNRRTLLRAIATTAIVVCSMIVGPFFSPAQAGDRAKPDSDPTPKLHVAGRFLQDPKGKSVTLHGYMQPGASWFNGEGHNFPQPSDYADPASVAPALTYYKAVANILSDPAPRYGQSHGWYCRYVRYIADGSGPQNFAPGWDAAGNLSKPEQFRGWMENVLVPFVKHCRARGLYVVLVGNPSETFPTGKDGKEDPGRNMSEQYQQNLIKFWTTVAAHPDIKSADNVHFEICNEPIAIETSFGANDWGSGNDKYDSAITSFMQPIVDAIRAQGADNVIWIPGLGWQGQYAGFANHPINGKNIGYAAHIYPAYGGAHDNADAVRKLWNRNYKPAADRWPMIITEMFWNPNGGHGYEGLWNAHTSGFGNAIRACLDEQGNVSFNIGMVGDLIGNLKGGLASSTLGDSEGARAAWDWYPEYQKSSPGRALPGSDDDNGMFTNPVLYGDYPDPDIIRVGSDFYLVPTTFVSIPGVEILHSKDLINWEIAGYAAPTIEVNPEYSMIGGTRYGQGVWAPCLRYHKGTFYIIDNLQGAGTVIYRAQKPAGPWKMNRLNGSLFDPGLMFDDDGTPLVYHGTHGDIRVAVLDPDLTRVVSTSPAYKIPDGEGSHAYKINGTYYVFNSLYGQYPTLICSRSKSPTGPFTTVTVCNNRTPWSSPHQGGIVQLENGDWWGFSLVDSGSVGRTMWVGPVTWSDGWPYFGDPASPTIPKINKMPNVGHSFPIKHLPGSDDFSHPRLEPQWQWNHNPDNTKWSLTARRGYMRLYTQTAPNYSNARNTLTQRTMGPSCTGVIKIDTGHMLPGDRAGLSLLEQYFSYLAVYKDPDGQRVVRVVNSNGRLRTPSEDITDTVPGVNGTTLWLQVACDFVTNTAQFSYSTDGKVFVTVGGRVPMHFTLATFQGVRFGIFNYNPAGSAGWLDIDSFRLQTGGQ